MQDRPRREVGLVQGALSQVREAGLPHPSILVGTRKQRRAPSEQELPGDAMCTNGERVSPQPSLLESISFSASCFSSTPPLSSASLSLLSDELKLREAELTQNLCPVGLGPSSKTCPMWLLQVAQLTSVRASDGLHTSSRRLAPTWDKSCFRDTLSQLMIS